MRKFPLLFLSVVTLMLVVTACGTRKRASSSSELYEPRQDRLEKIDSKTAARILREAERWKGTRYSYGGKTRKGTDCSGMVMTIYQDVAGIKLPRSAAEQQAYCRQIDRKKLQPADLVFFTTSRKRGRVNHVGIYAGSGRFIHASSSRGVISSSLDEDYYVRHYHSSGRVEALASAKSDRDEPQPMPEVVPEKIRVDETPVIMLDDYIKRQTPVRVDTVSVDIIDVDVIEADSLTMKADTIRAEVRRAF